VFHENFSLASPLSLKLEAYTRVERVAKVVSGLPRKFKALDSNPSTAKKKKGKTNKTQKI
jgi:hypothetical protein